MIGRRVALAIALVEEPAPTAKPIYISVPVATSENIYGLLCVDAPMPGDLTANDLKTMVLLAQALTVALAI